MIELSEMQQRVIRAAVDYLRGRVAAEPGESAMECIVRISGVPIGHVRSTLTEFDIHGLYERGDLHFATPSLEAMEAFVEMPIAPARAGTMNHVSVTGSSNQLQVGEQVSGSQSMVTYQQVIESLQQAVERSDMPAEHKKNFIAKLGDALKTPGVIDLLKTAASVVMTHLPHIG
jgi:hypothetical protein